MKKERIKAIIGIVLIVILFVFISYISKQNVDYFKSNLVNSYWGMLIYFVLVILEIVFAPITFIPFIPLASAIWGSFKTFLLTLGAWTIGSIIAFIIASEIGGLLLEKIVSVKELNKVKRIIPNKRLFLGVIILRIILPIDIMSYAIGLFTDIDLKRYSLATLIGYAPIVFILSYFGEISFKLQIILFSIGLIFFIIFVLSYKKFRSFFDKLFKS